MYNFTEQYRTQLAIIAQAMSEVEKINEQLLKVASDKGYPNGDWSNTAAIRNSIHMFTHGYFHKTPYGAPFTTITRSMDIRDHNPEAYLSWVKKLDAQLNFKDEVDK